MPLDQQDLLDPARSLHARLVELRNRHCRQDFLSFCTAALRSRGEAPALHHKLICRELQSLADGSCKRLMILAPPGSAKTSYVSRLFPAWYFSHRPGSSIIACSHTQELSETNSGFVQRIIRDNTQLLGYNLSNDAKGRWLADNNSNYLAGSVGAAILGFRSNIAIIDDPLRSRQEADSEVSREHTWLWFTNDLLSRLTPDGAIVLIATPFHEDDLMGRLQRVQKGEWKVLRLPALSEGPETDPLGRAEGEPLWSDGPYGYGARLLEIHAAAEREGRSRDWFAQYQATPRAPEGAMFKPARMPVFDSLPPGARIIEQARGWDLAASVRGDFTVGLKLARLWGDPRWQDLYLITDVQRLRGPPDEVRTLIRTVAAADGYNVKQWFAEDPGQAGKDQSLSIVQMLSGYRVAAIRQSGDKATRADACASQANIGKVGMLRADWNNVLLDELGSFPVGQHDDIVDALSLCFNQMAANDVISVWARL